jgi:hypothetical protein
MYVSMLRLYVLPSLRNKVYVETKQKIPVGARFFAHVHTGPGAHPASCTMGTGSFPGVKRPERGADHPPPPSTEVEMSRAIPLLLLWALCGLIG